jgi:PQQ-like domain
MANSDGTLEGVDGGGSDLKDEKLGRRRSAISLVALVLIVGVAVGGVSVALLAIHGRATSLGPSVPVSANWPDQGGSSERVAPAGGPRPPLGSFWVYTGGNPISRPSLSAPVEANGTIVTSTGASLIALDSTGKTAWTVDAAAEGEGFISPTISGDLVVSAQVLPKGRLTVSAFALSTGASAWSWSVSGLSAAHPVLASSSDGVLIAGGGSVGPDNTWFLSPGGNLSCALRIPGGEGRVGAALSGNLAVIQGSRALTEANLADCSSRWRVSLGGSPGSAQPAIHRQVVVALSGVELGAYSLTTGEQVSSWGHVVDFAAGSRVYASTVRRERGTVLDSLVALSLPRLVPTWSVEKVHPYPGTTVPVNTGVFAVAGQSPRLIFASSGRVDWQTDIATGHGGFQQQTAGAPLLPEALISVGSGLVLTSQYGTIQAFGPKSSSP